MLHLALATALLPQEPTPITDATRELPALGITIRDQRVLDPSTGWIHRYTTDAATGAVVDADALLVAETEAGDRRHGKLSLDLRKQLEQRQPDEALMIAVWLQRPAGLPDLRLVLEQARAAGATAADARRTALAAAAKVTVPVTAAFAAALAAQGFEIAYTDPYTPVVFVRLRAREVAAVAARAGVDQVYYSFPTCVSEVGALAPNQYASPSARTDVVHRRGIDGAGVLVLVNDIGGIYRTNPNLPTITVGNPTIAWDPHSTAVAGIVCSRHPLYKGAAPGLAQLLDYGISSDVDAPQAWNWGMQQGISFGNCSWWNFNMGSIAFLDRYFDYIIRNFAVQMFKAGGNRGNAQPCTTPGLGFNCVSVGNANDRNTHDWDDDMLSTSSSTGNPQPSDHEKPEVCAHGTGIETAVGFGFGNAGSGTSFSAPVVCGTAALLAQTDPALQAAPEAVKALLMAGAWNDIHGGQPLSDWDGAGAIDAAASQSALAAGQLVRATLTPASFPGGVWSHAIHLDRGDETRICAVWTALADSAFTSTALEMDLDMVVLDPAGLVVGSSASTKNPFEIVQFVPASTGTYTVQMQSMRFLGASEPFALAWTTSWDTRTASVMVIGAPRLGYTIALEFADRYHPGQVYFGIVSATPYPATWTLPMGKLLRVGFDGLANASLGLPGFVGVLPADGIATTSLTIPNLAPLAGMTVHFAMVTAQTGLPLAEEVGDVTSVTILP